MALVEQLSHIRLRPLRGHEGGCGQGLLTVRRHNMLWSTRLNDVQALTPFVLPRLPIPSRGVHACLLMVKRRRWEVQSDVVPSSRRGIARTGGDRDARSSEPCQGLLRTSYSTTSCTSCNHGVNSVAHVSDRIGDNSATCCLDCWEFFPKQFQYSLWPTTSLEYSTVQ